MKKVIKKTIALLMALLLVFPMTAYAETNDDWQDVDVNNEKIQEIFSQNSEVAPLTTGLIVAYSIGLAHDGRTLYIGGKTLCLPDVVKSGFEEVIIQRRRGGAYAWSNYVTYEDLYVDGSSYVLTKSRTVTTGFQYRAVCVHYAKKNLFSKERINNTSTTIVISQS